MEISNPIVKIYQEHQKIIHLYISNSNLFDLSNVSHPLLMASIYSEHPSIIYYYHKQTLLIIILSPFGNLYSIIYLSIIIFEIIGYCLSLTYSLKQTNYQIDNQLLFLIILSHK